jgi:hypothetical protein
MEVGQGPNWGCSAKEKEKNFTRGEGVLYVHIYVLQQD